MAVVGELAQPSLFPLRARRALWILTVFFVVQFLAAFVVAFSTTFFMTFLAAIQSTAGVDARAAASASTVPAAIVGIILSGLLAVRMSRRTFAHSPDEFHRTVGWSPASTPQIVRSALVGVALSVLYLFVACLVSPPTAEQSWHPFREPLLAGGWQRHGWAFLALVVAPPVEEFVFRGVVFAGLARSWSVPAAGLVTTVLFVFAHGVTLHPYWPSMIAITALAVAALRARVVTQSLAPCIAMHAAYNLGMVVTSYVAIP